MSDAKRYWIPGPLTNYGTTANGFAGEVLKVCRARYLGAGYALGRCPICERASESATDAREGA